MSLAEDILNQLLQRGERAARRGSNRAIQERFDGARSAYWRLALSERDGAHERFLAAQQAGAVELKWSRQGGDDRPLEIVRLRDLDKLAVFLGTRTLVQSIRQAETVLSPWLSRNERVREIVDRWRSGKAVRGLSPSSALDFADALRVVEAAESSADGDQVVRVLSARLFRDSKRIEQLVRHLDVLTADVLMAKGRHWDEVLSPLGLVKEPQPFLVAGSGVLRLSGAEECPIARPFVGVASKAVSGYRGKIGWVLTIENLTTFHMAADALGEHSDGLVVYTAGMPSPAWGRAYQTILASLPEAVPAYHWGDIDVGGFRIAVHIKRHIEAERDFLPWLMDATGHSGSRRADAVDSKQMSSLAKQAGWSGLEDRVFDFSIEQEHLSIRLPNLAPPK